MRLIAILLFPLALSAQVPSLKGSGKALTRDNLVADKDKLSKIKNDEEIARFKRRGILVSIPDGKYGLVVDSRLEADRRLCRPVTIRFLKKLGTMVEKKFGRPLQVNSCTRDVETQTELRERNKNAAPITGPHASLHLRGNTVDIRRLGVPADAQSFVNAELLALEKQCKIDATKERLQAVWHVVVFNAYDKKGSACAKSKKPRSKK